MRRLVGLSVALALGVPVLAATNATTVAAASVPAGFADTGVAGFSQPTTID